ncbi:Hypothetical Protein XCAW_02443 [Xanthomonas citri subsp. citri Aw12879]|nr:Hypothetical Protein XCAW_02443 [Xanthomonas citri subsp. citri Aw12879]
MDIDTPSTSASFIPLDRIVKFGCTEHPTVVGAL